MRRTLASVIMLVTAGCGGAQWQPPPCNTCGNLVEPIAAKESSSAPVAERPSSGDATVEGAAAFMARTEAELLRLYIKNERAQWVSANFITGDTQEIAAETEEELLGYVARVIKESTRYDGLKLPPELARKFTLLKIGTTLPAPADPQKTAELARISSDMKAMYGTSKYCPKKDGALRRELAKNKDNAEALACDPAAGDARSGVSLDVLSKLMLDSRDEAALREAWIGWHSISPPMRPLYQRFVELANQGARELGFADVGALWRGGYDMSAEEFRADTKRLWQQVQPFYEELHCYVRKRLREKYGNKMVPPKGPIPAHLFGNMWSQQWSALYPLVEPYKNHGAPDVTKAIERKKLDELGMVKMAEGFFTSLGLDPLPKTFWERSLFVRPRDREVQCHASAWDVHYNGDLRIKMCIQKNEEDLQTIHHELGHNYYYMYYNQLPILFQAGANDGFHEAIGDAIALSVTPGYLHKVGLGDKPKEDDKATINYLLKMSLEKVAFLPFGKLIDEWRWDVFAGKIPAGQYNAGWWKLRTEYQGIAPPEPRGEQFFDPGAKYHVPSNVPYTRYFLAFIYQFQFHRALCRAAGHEGPLHTCSIYDNKAAGEKMKALLALGASKPWQEALQAMSGEGAGDANALLEYFAPLRGWLKKEVAGETCGW